MSLILNTLQDLTDAIAKIGGTGSKINAGMLENLKSNAFARAFGDATKRFKVANPVTGNDAVNMQSLREIGVGQTWVDETANRAKAITYTNSSNKPIQVLLNLGGDGSGNNSCTFYIDNVDSGEIRTDHDGKTISPIVNIIIPAGSVYKVDGSLTIVRWLELK